MINKRGCRYWINIGLFTLATLLNGALFLLFIGHPFFLSWGWAHPNSPPICCQTPADYDWSYEEVNFTTTDGVTLRGWYIPSQNGVAIILAHPIGANRIAMLDVADMLAKHGYGVLLYDIRTHGESGGEVLPYGGSEAEDMRAAATFLQARPEIDSAKIGAMGHSLGAQINILSAAQSGQIQAVAADGPCCTMATDFPPPEEAMDWIYVPYDAVFFPLLNWRTGVSNPLSIREAISMISPRPLLLIGSGREQRSLEHLSQDAAKTVQIWIIPEATHIDGLQVAPDEYENRVITFFDQALFND